jgi:RNA polymerase-binding transcription factor DksA
MASNKKSTAKKADKSTLKKAPAAPIKAKPVASAPTAKSAAADKPAKSSAPMEKPSKKSALRDSILKRKAPTKPIAFSLDEVRAIAKTVTSKTNVPFPEKTAKGASAKAAAILEKPVKPSHVKAASLSDILGFNPKKSKPRADLEEAEIPEKFHRYYKLLVELRSHLTGQIDQHTEETLKRSSKDDAGDLSAYGQHMADAGTDTFDRDFALSMVANEQEALSEIEAAIKRIKDGTYGVCEVTQKPIAKERLLAVPFTRYSAEAQKDLERNRHRARTQAGLFAEMGEEGGKMSDDDGGGDE